MVEVAALPEAARQCPVPRKFKLKLLFGNALLGAEFAGNTLFENLNDFGRSRAHWLTDEQVDMIRHENITDKRKLESRANFAEDSNGNVLVSDGRKKVAPLIASKGDEVEVIASDDSFEVVRHKEGEQIQSKSRNRTQSPPFAKNKTAKGRPLEVASGSHVEYGLQW